MVKAITLVPVVKSVPRTREDEPDWPATIVPAGMNRSRIAERETRICVPRYHEINNLYQFLLIMTDRPIRVFRWT
jgi:hypothetical protein